MSLPPFQFFHPARETLCSFRNLPHWHQDGTCAFVTMRLHDSIPKSVRDQILSFRSRWLKSMGVDPQLPPELLFQKLSEREKRKFQRMASKSYQRALDKGWGNCVFSEYTIRENLLTELHRGHGDYYRLGDGVIMPNHLHILIQPLGENKLQNILSALRRMSARNINRQLKRSGTFWQPEPFDHLVRSEGQFKRFCQYIELNPVRARLSPKQYSHWRSEDL